MPLQNRVTPAGEIVAADSRGLVLGNRGCLHGDRRELGVSRWRSKLWICCVLEWKGVRRDPMPPGRWTALFFLDEVTALAAGHRPCGYCRRRDYLDFALAWQAAEAASQRPLAWQMDAVLHAQRTDRRRRKLTHAAAVNTLPDGVMVRIGGNPSLHLAGRFLPWSFTGYGPPVPAPPPNGLAEVLTPPAVTAAIRAGYRPLLHPQALAACGLSSAPSGLRAHDA
jgi:hypothetical protein